MGNRVQRGAAGDHRQRPVTERRLRIRPVTAASRRVQPGGTIAHRFRIPPPVAVSQNEPGMTQPPLKHRIVSTAIKTILACALFLTSYVSGWLGLAWLNGRGIVRSTTVGLAQTTIYAPINGYLISGYPGAEKLEILRRQCQSQGWLAKQRALDPQFDELQQPVKGGRNHDFRRTEATIIPRRSAGGGGGRGRTEWLRMPLDGRLPRRTPRTNQLGNRQRSSAVVSTGRRLLYERTSRRKAAQLHVVEREPSQIAIRSIGRSRGDPGAVCTAQATCSKRSHERLHDRDGRTRRLSLTLCHRRSRRLGRDPALSSPRQQTPFAIPLRTSTCAAIDGTAMDGCISSPPQRMNADRFSQRILAVDR